MKRKIESTICWCDENMCLNCDNKQKREKERKFTTSKDAPMLEDMPRPSLYEYVRLRIGMKLYKWGIIKGWSYSPIDNKTYFYWKS